MRSLPIIILAAFLVVSVNQVVRAVEVSGLVSLVAKDADKDYSSNETFRGFNNFHSSRARLFFDTAVNDKTSVFVQLLIDQSDIVLYGAYARFEQVGSKYINIQAGFIPHTVGTYGPRTYSNVNPLIGTPLLYNYHSSFRPMSSTPVGDADNLVANKVDRRRNGLPVIYDACWNSGLEVYGNYESFGYSVGFLAGSLSKPTQEQSKNEPQLTTRLYYALDPGLVFGFSAYSGPYLLEGMVSDPIPVGKDESDYMSSGFGYDFYLARGLFELYSETIMTTWEYPTLPDLELTCGFVEGKYKFLPSWYLAGRYGYYLPGEVMVTGGGEDWDYSVKRYEFGVGHWLSRDVVAKLVAQLNRFEQAKFLDSDLFALQIAMSVY